MPPTPLLITILMLFANGTPASHAEIRCTQVSFYGDSDTNDAPGDVGTADSRGAVILEASAPMVSACVAWKGEARWSGDLSFEELHQVIRVYLSTPAPH